MKTYEVEVVDSNTELASQMTRFEELLVAYGLPSENIIASLDERNIIMSTVPTFLNGIPEEKCNLFIKIYCRLSNRII